jgi:hypothetical protein
MSNKGLPLFETHRIGLRLWSPVALRGGLALFKTMYHHYWPLRPQATASYVQAYREMWDDEGVTDSIEEQS